MMKEQFIVSGYEKEEDYFNSFKTHPIEELILKYVDKGPILDVGCGNGCLLDSLKENFDVEGFDPSKCAIKIAKRKGLNCFLSTINAFNPTKRYETILIIGVIAHLYNLEKDFEKILGWLEDKGKIYITIPNASSPFIKWDLKHINRFNYFEFRKFLKRHKLKIKKCVGAGRLKYFPYLSTVNLYIVSKNSLIQLKHR